MKISLATISVASRDQKLENLSLFDAQLIFKVTHIRRSQRSSTSRLEKLLPKILLRNLYVKLKQIIRELIRLISELMVQPSWRVRTP